LEYLAALQGKPKNQKEQDAKLQFYKESSPANYYYYKAQNSASKDPDAAIEFLEQSLNAGHRYDFYSFGNDPYLRGLHGDAGFEKVLGYWR